MRCPRHALLSVVAVAILLPLVLAVGRAPCRRIDRPGADIVGATRTIAAGVISLDAATFTSTCAPSSSSALMALNAHVSMTRFFSTTVEWRTHLPAT
jgi:hypothetical protein